MSIFRFLGASNFLYDRLCSSVGQSVCWSVTLLLKWQKSPRIIPLSMIGPQIKVRDQSIIQSISSTITQNTPGFTSWPCFFATLSSSGQVLITLDNCVLLEYRRIIPIFMKLRHLLAPDINYFGKHLMKSGSKSAGLICL